MGRTLGERDGRGDIRVYFDSNSNSIMKYTDS